MITAHLSSWWKIVGSFQKLQVHSMNEAIITERYVIWGIFC